jgi:hypothetical protein
VEAVTSDWNRVRPENEAWKFMDISGRVLVICNNFNFCNDMTQENMERLILGRCKPGTLVLLYSTSFASRGEATTLVWSKRFTFPMSENQKITNRHYSGHKSYLYLHKSCIICMLSFLKK